MELYGIVWKEISHFPELYDKHFIFGQPGCTILIQLEVISVYAILISNS